MNKCNHVWYKCKKYIETKDKNGNDTIRAFRVCQKCKTEKEILTKIVCHTK